MATTILKPAGIPVFPPHDDPTGDCVLARLTGGDPPRRGVAWPPGFEGGIAHRLDTSTSGALWVADDPGELERMRMAFAEKRLRKTYVLRTAKRVPWDTHETDVALAHDRDRKGRVAVRRGRDTPHRGAWHDAHTRFRRLSEHVFEAEMFGAFQHQIRAHAAFLGIAIEGDRLYGGGPTPPDAPPGLTFFLHHRGLVDRDGWGTAPVATPEWAVTGGPARRA
jgi:23S rRNA-/tRNA-specific pseudouridylate synthase